MAPEVRSGQFTLRQIEDALAPHAQAMASLAFPRNLGPTPEYIRIRFGPRGNDDLAAAPKFSWFDSLSNDAKDSCLREMLAVPSVAALADGSRDAWLKIVAACARSGAPAARELCRAWSQTSDKYHSDAFDRDFSSFEAVPGEIGVATLIHHAVQGGFEANAYQERGWARPESSESDGALSAGTRKDTVACLDRFRMSKNMAVTHRRRPLHGGDLYRGEVAGLNAPGGFGKSTIALGIAVALASGRPLLGQAVLRPMAVLYANSEDTTAGVQLSIQAYMKHHQLPPAEVHELFAIGADDLGGISITEVDPQTRQARIAKAGLQKLERMIVNCRAEVLIVDPLSMVITAGQNFNEVVYPAMLELKKLAAKHDCAILLVAHTKKGGTVEHDGAEATRGAGAITDAMRVVKGVRRISPDDAQQLGVPFGDEANVRHIVDQKTNYTPVQGGRYVMLTGVPMGNAQPPDYPDQDWVPIAVPFTPTPGGRSVPLAASRAVLVVLAHGTASGEALGTAKQAKGSYFGDAVGQALAPFLSATGRALETAARGVVDDLIRRGWVEVIDVPGSCRRTRKGIRVIWVATPWASEPAPAGANIR